MNHDEMKKFFDDFSNQLDKKFNKQFEKHTKDIGIMLDKKLSATLAPVMKKVEELNVKVTAVEKKVSESEDISSRVNNLKMNSLPYKEGEDLSSYFASLSSKLGYESPPEVRIRRFNGSDNEKRPVLFTFPTEFHKLEFLKKFKSKSADMVRGVFPGFASDKTRIYLQHDFTSTQYQLHKFAMSLLKQEKLLKVNVHAGNKIVIQISEDDKLTHFVDAEALKEEIERRQNLAKTSK